MNDLFLGKFPFVRVDNCVTSSEFNVEICRGKQKYCIEVISLTFQVYYQNALDVGLKHVCCCMVFKQFFNNISVISLKPVHLSMLYWSYLTSTKKTKFFPSHWLLSQITNIETMDSCERGINPVAMSIINPPEEYWPSQKCFQMLSL